MVNLSHPFNSEFQIGDRFEIQIAGLPRQPISVRTVRQGRTDWGPIIASTDGTGRWSTAGWFDRSDFGSWSQTWTVGGRLITPAIQFDVKAPCLPGGRDQLFMSGPNVILSCDTAEGSQTFVTPSLSDPFQTPDGRSIPGRPGNQTAEQYHMEILSDLITSGVGEHRKSLASSRGGLGDDTGNLIGQLIGENALSEKETQNVLIVIRAEFERPETIAPDAKMPWRTVVFLQHLTERTDQVSVKQQIVDTIAYVRNH